MTITIESTDTIIGLTKNGPHEGSDVTVPARIWTGSTEQGVPIYVFVTRIAVHQDHDTAQFERELHEVPHLRGGLNDLFPHGIPTRLVL